MNIQNQKRIDKYEDRQKFITWRCGYGDLDYFPNLRLNTVLKIHVPLESDDENHWNTFGEFKIEISRDNNKVIIPDLTWSKSYLSNDSESDEENRSLEERSIATTAKEGWDSN